MAASPTRKRGERSIGGVRKSDKGCYVKRRGPGRRPGGTAGISGRTVRVGEMAFTIVGVAAPEFVGALLDWSDLPDIWIPFDFTSLALGRDLIDRRVPWHMALKESGRCVRFRTPPVGNEHREEPLTPTTGP